jgi:hypothetical protein
VYCTVVRTEYNVFRMCTCSHRSVQERIHRSWPLGDARLGHVSFAGRAGGGQLNHRRILGRRKPRRREDVRDPGLLARCTRLRSRTRAGTRRRCAPSSLHAHTHAFLIGSRARARSYFSVPPLQSNHPASGHRRAGM